MTVRVSLTMRGRGLDAMDPLIMGGKSDPYLVFKIEGKKIGQTEVIKNNLNPRWKPVVLELPDCNNNGDGDDDGDDEPKITIECWDFDKASANDIIGSVEVKCSQLLEEDAEFYIDRSAGIMSLFTNHRKQSGTLIVYDACIESDDHRDEDDLVVDRSKPVQLARGLNATSPVAKMKWKGGHVIMTITNNTGKVHDGTLTLFGGLKYFTMTCGKQSSWTLEPNKTIGKTVLTKKHNADQHRSQWQLSFRFSSKPRTIQDSEVEKKDTKMWKDPSTKDLWNFKSGDYCFDSQKLCEKWVPARILGEDESAVLFDGIEANDIAQGRIGDCWVLSAIACLAEHKKGESVKKLFKTKAVNPAGKYTIQLFNVATGKWDEHTIDESVPCRKRSDGSFESVVADPYGEEIWVPLLEKAMAKHFGGYRGIGNGGQEFVALQCLTGTIECKHYERKDSGREWKNLVIRHSAQKAEGKPVASGSWFYSPTPGQEEVFGTVDQFFNHIQRLINKQHLLCCSMDKGNHHVGEGKADLGLVTGHAYSILSVRYLKLSSKPNDAERFIKLRNPWGSTEWQGKWSDGDPLWKQYPNVAYTLGYSKKEDGAFWMPFDYFFKNFNDVQVCLCGVKDRDLLGPDDQGGEPVLSVKIRY